MALTPLNLPSGLKILNLSENTIASWGLCTIRHSKFRLFQSNGLGLNEEIGTVCLLCYRKCHNFILPQFLMFLLEACCTEIYNPTEQKFNTL